MSEEHDHEPSEAFPFKTATLALGIVVFIGSLIGASVVVPIQHKQESLEARLDAVAGSLSTQIHDNDKTTASLTSEVYANRETLRRYADKQDAFNTSVIEFMAQSRIADVQASAERQANKELFERLEKAYSEGRKTVK